jgi:hypothetical protein
MVGEIRGSVISFAPRSALSLLLRGIHDSINEYLWQYGSPKLYMPTHSRLDLVFVA